MCEGVNVYPARSDTLSRSSLWGSVTRPPSYIRGRDRLWIRCYSRHSMWEGLGYLVHTAGRGRHAIPALSALSHLLWTAAPSARTKSLAPVTVKVWVEPGPLPMSTPVPPLPAVVSFAELSSVLPGDSTSGLPSGTPSDPWVLRKGVLWWNRTPSSFQGPSELVQEGPILFILLAGRWTLFLVIPPPFPQTEPSWRSTAVPSPPGQRRHLCPG